jgi:hypothetical protein
MASFIKQKPQWYQHGLFLVLGELVYIESCLENELEGLFSKVTVTGILRTRKWHVLQKHSFLTLHRSDQSQDHGIHVPSSTDPQDPEDICPLTLRCPSPLGRS